MNEPAKMFEEALDWLRDHYHEFLFRKEDDVVTVLWAHLVRMVNERCPQLQVDHEQNFAVSVGRFQCDIVIFNIQRKPLVCVEVKYEPSRTRTDIHNRALKHSRPQHLLPGHGLKKFRCDIERIPYYVTEIGAECSYAIFIDENSYHYSRLVNTELPEGTSWVKWGAKSAGGFETAIMVTRYPIFVPRVE